MGNINLKDYEFDEQLLKNVAIFDEVLNECGQPSLLENSHFSQFLDFPTTSRYLVVELNTLKSNTVPIVIWFEGEDLRIDIEGMNETFDWSKKQIEETREKIVEHIRNLFTGFILIETRKSSRFIQIFDADGFLCRRFPTIIYFTCLRAYTYFVIKIIANYICRDFLKGNNFYVPINPFQFQRSHRDKRFKT